MIGSYKISEKLERTPQLLFTTCSSASYLLAEASSIAFSLTQQDAMNTVAIRGTVFPSDSGERRWTVARKLAFSMHGSSLPNAYFLYLLHREEAPVLKRGFPPYPVTDKGAIEQHTCSKTRRFYCLETSCRRAMSQMRMTFLIDHERKNSSRRPSWYGKGVLSSCCIRSGAVGAVADARRRQGA